MLSFNAERVRTNAQQATTEDLLDRITVYRAGMEAEAVDIIERELRGRGVNIDAIDAHAEQRRGETMPHGDGPATKCSFCDRPAVAEGWGWHWLAWPPRTRVRRLVPLFPCYFRYCAEHKGK